MIEFGNYGRRSADQLALIDGRLMRRKTDGVILLRWSELP